jgi:hypothetical protein
MQPNTVLRSSESTQAFVSVIITVVVALLLWMIVLV